MARGLKERVESLEGRMILSALRRSNGIQSRAARELGITERTIRYKMRKYGLKIKTKMSEPDNIVEIYIHSGKH